MIRLMRFAYAGFVIKNNSSLQSSLVYYVLEHMIILFISLNVILC